MNNSLYTQMVDKAATALTEVRKAKHAFKPTPKKPVTNGVVFIVTIISIVIWSMNPILLNSVDEALDFALTDLSVTILAGYIGLALCSLAGSVIRKGFDNLNEYKYEELVKVLNQFELYELKGAYAVIMAHIPSNSNVPLELRQNASQAVRELAIALNAYIPETPDTAKLKRKLAEDLYKWAE